jgi:hypothetical protein
MYLALLPDACHLRSLLFTGRTSQLSLSRFLLQKLRISQNPWQIDGTMIGSISQHEPLVDLQLDLWEDYFDKMEQPRNTVALKTRSLTGSLQSMSGFMTKFPIAPRSLSSVHFNPVSFLVTSEGFIHPFCQHSDHIPAQSKMSFSLTRDTQNISEYIQNLFILSHKNMNTIRPPPGEYNIWPALEGTETSGAGWVADIVESQLSSRNVIVPGVEHRDAPARAATMVRDVVGNALQVSPRLSFSVLQESTDILLARNLLSVVEPGVIFSAVDVPHEEGGDVSGFAMALAAALAVESQGKGSVGSGESNDKRHESELHSERNEKEFSCIYGAHMKCSRVEEG